MKEDNNIQLNAIDAAKNASDVTPDKRKQGLIRQAQLALLGVVCLIIALIMFLPHQSNADSVPEESHERSNDFTLSENLQLIERMKEAQRLKLQASGQSFEKKPRVRHPPILRTKSYDDTYALSKEMQLRMNASTTFDVDTKVIASASQDGIQGNAQSNGFGKTLVGQDSNSQFVNDQTSVTAVSATKLLHPELTVPAGEMIPATLETAINSDLPGMARAITTRDVYALTEGNILIPRGSTLVGQFSANIAEGQNRIMVVWNRVQMNDGVIVTLNSPGTDGLGRAGQGADYTDRHFYERFGTSALLSVLGAYTATAGVGTQDQYNSASQYRMAIANSFQQSADQTLDKSINIKPTLQVNQGTQINIFVAHDLDFSAVGKRADESAYLIRRAVWK